VSPDGKPESSTVSVEIDVTSISAGIEKLTNHLKSADFFDVEKFPKATFVSTSVKPGGEKGATHTVTGNLTMHGVTKSISFPATIRLAPDSAEADAEFAINRKDFGVMYAGKADDLIRDDVLIKLTIRAKKAGA
jgi:polyisoprenoid-binding protein YceI